MLIIFNLVNLFLIYLYNNSYIKLFSDLMKKSTVFEEAYDEFSNANYKEAFDIFTKSIY